jgi:hypothetical protein
MSHSATNWAIKQRGLKPIAKLVLWHLADCHNPVAGCFPTQEYLARECEVSRASVNRYLDELETMGLIRREQRLDEETKRQLPTRYFLACEESFNPLDIESRVSDSDTEPCLNLEGVRVSENEGAVSQSYETLTSKGTSKENQEKKARELFGSIPASPVVSLHTDDPVFREIVRRQGGREPPVGRSGYWSFPAELVEQAKQKLAA